MIKVLRNKKEAKEFICQQINSTSRCNFIPDAVENIEYDFSIRIGSWDGKVLECSNFKLLGDWEFPCIVFCYIDDTFDRFGKVRFRWLEIATFEELGLEKKDE